MGNYCGNCFQESLNDRGVCLVCGYDQGANREAFPAALPAGSILDGRYIVGRVLGQGGFGITYTARDHQTGTTVAIKEFFPDTMATRAGVTTVRPYTGDRGENFDYGRTTFLEEARTMAQFIGNPGVVRVHSYFEENNTGYFVMEYVQGQSMQAYIRSRGGRLSWEEAVSVLVPVAEALDAVHSRGIIHRDVTPDNIYITAEGAVKLLDFGSARYSLGNVSRSLDVILKHGFAPKEQYKRRGRQGPYTDVYSLGATLYFALTGVRPDDAIERQDADDMPLPSSLGAMVQPWQEDVILKAMEVEPENRYQTMAEFKAAMQTRRPEPAPAPKPAPKPIPKPAPEPVPVPDPVPKSIPKPDSILKSIPKPAFKPIKMSRKKRMGIMAAVIVLAVAAGVLMTAENSYREALGLLDGDRYEEAAQSFGKLGFYRDSRTLQVWSQAEAFMEDGNYTDALQALEKIPNYPQTAERKNRIIYELAVKDSNEGRHEQAYNALESISGFSDADNRKERVAIQWAMKAMQDLSLEEANKVKPFLRQMSVSNMRSFYISLRNTEYREGIAQTVMEQYLNMIRDKVPEAEKLHDFLTHMSPTDKCSTILNNRQTLEKLWDVPYIQSLAGDDAFITFWLRGEWKTEDGKYIKFYNKEGNDVDVTTVSFNLPTETKPKNMKYFDIQDMVYVWTDEDENVLTNVFRFQFTADPDRMTVYCHKNQTNYTVTRDQVS